MYKLKSSIVFRIYADMTTINSLDENLGSSCSAVVLVYLNERSLKMISAKVVFK